MALAATQWKKKWHDGEQWALTAENPGFQPGIREAITWCVVSTQQWGLTDKKGLVQIKIKVSLKITNGNASSYN